MNRLVNKKPIAGFTLVEVLIYIFVFILLSGGALGMFFSLNDLFVQYKARQAVLTSGTAIMERILLEIREADTVITAGADNLTLNNDSSTINIEKISDDIKVNSIALNASTVDVTSVNFTSYTTADGVNLVRVSLGLSSSLGGQTETWTIYSGAILRGSI